MAGPLLSLQGLCAGYGDRRVVDGVELEVHPGELWAVLGPNGAGKSTLVRAAMGLLPLQAGRAVMFGTDVSQWSKKALAKRCAWVPQVSDALPDFTALELVLMGRAPHLSTWALASKKDRSLAEAALEELGIASLQGRALGELSGGERRLVMLARALAQEPELLFLDEPTAYLDMGHQLQALQLVRHRTLRGMSVVAVLHDLNLASAFASQALLMRAGRTLAKGPIQSVLVPSQLSELYGVAIATAAAPGGQALFAPRV